jgi:5-methylcytosine-specific restriction endonuclease McrA
MQPHIKAYFKYYNYKLQSDILCEVCNSPAVDIHHIEGRMKHNPELNKVENLIGLCRACHSAAHASKLTKEYLQDIHETNMDAYNG